MARSRSPIGMQVNGVALLVKDPDAASTALFGKYQRVPGLANFTLPDETGSSNETQLQDGNIAFAQIAGVGTITGSIGAVSGHATHRFLANKRRDGGNVTVAVVRPAIRLSAANQQANFSVGANDATVEATGSAAIALAKAHAKEGVFFAIGSTGTDFADEDAIFYGSTVAAGDDDHFRPILAVNDDGEHFELEVPHTTGVAANAGNVCEFRQAGVLYEGIVCTVNGFGDGDFQAGGAVTANISFQPSVALPVMTAEHRLRGEYGTALDGVFADVT